MNNQYKAENSQKKIQSNQNKWSKWIKLVTYGSTLSSYLAIAITSGYLLFDSATMQKHQFDKNLQISTSNTQLYFSFTAMT